MQHILPFWYGSEPELKGEIFVVVFFQNPSEKCYSKLQKTKTFFGNVGSKLKRANCLKVYRNYRVKN